MKKLSFACIFLQITFVFVFNALGSPLTDQYSVTTSVTNVGTNEYVFEYYVTNLNQTVDNWMGFGNGLDGFAIMVPESATVIYIENPEPYNPTYVGSWENSITGTLPNFNINGLYRITNGDQIFSDAGYEWIAWWGNELGSIYPIGTTAHFLVQIANVDLGYMDAALTTFWWYNPMGTLEPNGGYYSDYTTQVLSPVAIAPVPEPSTFILLGVGLASLAVWRRKRS